MDYANPDSLVSTEWLAKHLSSPDVRVIDASWHFPSTGRDAKKEYDERHIPGAVHFDIDEIADKNSPLPHMLPDSIHFASQVRRLGLGDGNRIVVYDSAGGGSAAARAWWMFRLFGHTDVAVLNGGLDKWVAEGRPIEDLPPAPRDRHFMAHVNQFLVRDIGQMNANLATHAEQVIDARSPDRFTGEAKEPWPGRKSGHVPGALNVFWGDLIDPESKTILPADALSARFDAAKLDRKKPIVAMCGSGVTACMLILGLHLLGRDDVALYDGSWAEWGIAPDAKIAVGPA
jgi:thiosulfate/3-mercaptopyruvate sulfurtransferase